LFFSAISLAFPVNELQRLAHRQRRELRSVLLAQRLHFLRHGIRALAQGSIVSKTAAVCVRSMRAAPVVLAWTMNIRMRLLEQVASGSGVQLLLLIDAIEKCSNSSSWATARR
jgi:hypothetical protein